MQDLASYAMGLDPAARAKIMAQAVRGRPLQEANRQAHSMDMPAMAAMMSNNPELAKAAEYGAKQRQLQHKPVQMGQQGFALPSSGEFVQSPMFEQEQEAARQSREQIAEANRQATLQRTMEAIRSREQMAADQRALRLTLGAATAGRAAERKAEKTAADAEKMTIKLGQDLDRRMSRFTTALDKAGVPDFEAALQIAEGRLNMHGEDIPGFGKLESLKPDWLQGLTDEEGMAARQDMQMAANILLKSRSGAAVTNSEALRFLREVAMGKVMSEKNLRHGWDNVRKVFEKKKANLFAGLSPEDLEEYNTRTGSSYKHPSRPGGDAGGPPPGVDKATWDHMTPEERALWK